MKNTEAFIEDRIKWRAAQHGLPKQRTYFWGSDRENPKIAIPARVGGPILVSEADNRNFVLLCTRGAIVVNDDAASLFMYADINEIHDLKVKPDEKKEELSKLNVVLKNGNEISVLVDSGSPAFGVWNILIMLIRMS